MKWYLVGKSEEPDEIIQSETRPLGLYDGGPYTSIWGPFNTLNVLLERMENPENLSCAKCGGALSFSYMEPTKSRMKDRKMCFRCNFWTDMLPRANDPYRYCIDGTMYYGKPEERGEGFGGREFWIRTNDGRTVHTWNLWCQGIVPPRFRAEIPDNAVFMNGEHWVQIGPTRVLAKWEGIMTLEKARSVLACAAEDREWTPIEEALYTLLVDLQTREEDLRGELDAVQMNQRQLIRIVEAMERGVRR